MAGASAPSAIIAHVAPFITLKTAREARPFAAARLALGFRSRAPPV
jgi:hypothetical protein